MKKKLAILLALTALVAALTALFIFPSSAETSGYYKYISDEQATITGVDAAISGAVTIPSTLDGCPVTSISYRAFGGCTNLTSITIPKSVTSISYDAFRGCTGLTSITIPFVGATKDGTSNTHFGHIFGATSYTYNDSYVPSSLKNVVITGGSSIGRGAFYNCTGLTSITIPKSVTSIGADAFMYCTGLTSITIPDGVTSIGDYAFTGCTGLTSITIPDGVTSIGDYVFSGCTGLTSITIPDGVTSIGSSAFYDCKNIQTVIYAGTKEDYRAISFANLSADPTCYGAKVICLGDPFTYIFFDEYNTTILGTATADYGTIIIPPTAPTKAPDAQYTYTFAGWLGYTEGMTLTEDVIFTATYTATVNKYTYTFFDEDGTTVLGTATVDYGSVITVPDDPTKAATQQYTYTFAGFEGFTDGMTLTEDVTFTATYKATVNKYTYTFFDEDGTTVLGTATVDYGTAITAPADPTKVATAQYTYTFAGWLGYTAGMLLTEDVTFTASYLTCLRFAIGDVNMDGAINALDSLLIKQHLVEMITLTETQLIYADACADGTVNALDAMYIEQYIVEMRDELGDYVTVTFVTEEGEKSATVKSGEDLTVIPEAPTGYEWSETENVYTAPDFTAIIADKKYYLWREGSIVIGGNGSDNSGDDQDWGKIN